MTKKIIFITLLVLSISSNAQDSLLLGKWQLSEIKQDNVITFDRNNAQVSIDAKYLNAKREKTKLTQVDSAAIVKDIEQIHPMMKLIFFEFLENDNLNAGVLDLKNDTYYFKTTTGGYVIDFPRIGITMGAFGSTIETYFYKISGDELVLIPIINGERSQGQYYLYERVSE